MPMGSLTRSLIVLTRLFSRPTTRPAANALVYILMTTKAAKAPPRATTLPPGERGLSWWMDRKVRASEDHCRLKNLHGRYQGWGEQGEGSAVLQ